MASCIFLVDVEVRFHLLFLPKPLRPEEWEAFPSLFERNLKTTEEKLRRILTDFRVAAFESFIAGIQIPANPHAL